ncbi:MAG: hypothetical protein FKY71_08320 [Spiribacter salinus]|uniref:Phage tail tape measure protein n=1 Tax=Spiribacter salinus TaxID=1335746 RepID=A0A540VRW9_9GAMM|nr:MAG: hypothetical protein FKY71_08320 [Spiribacter salinus]
MIVRELLTRLGFDADNRQATSYDKALRGVKNTALALTAAVAAVSAGIAKFTADAGRTGDELAKTSTRLGIATGDLQAYRFAAERSGVATATFDMAVQRLGRRVGEAAKGTGEAQDALKTLGISATEADGSVRSISDLLPEIADKLGTMENANQRNALAMKLFDSEGVRMVQMLKDGSAGLEGLLDEFESLGITLSEDQVKAAVEYTDSMSNLTTVLRGVKNLLGAELLPQVTEAIKATIDWWKANQDLLKQNVGGFVRGLMFTVRLYFGVLREMAQAVYRVVDATVGWGLALKTLGLFLSTVMSYMFAKWLWIIASALLGTTKAMGLLRAVTLAFQRLAIVALFLGLAVALEDVYRWINDNDSMLKRHVGSYEDFKKKVQGVLDKIRSYLEPYKEDLKAVGDIIAGWFTLDVARILRGFDQLGSSIKEWAAGVAAKVKQLFLDMLPSMPEWLKSEGTSGSGSRLEGRNRDIPEQMGRSGGGNPGNRSATANVTNNITVPPGTNEEQARSISKEVSKATRREFDRIVEETLWNYQPVD